MRIRRVASVVAIGLLMVLFCARGFAQNNVNEEQGLKPYDALTGSDIDSVSVTNGGLTLHIPLASFPQRGALDLSFFLRYSTHQWSVFQTCVNDPDTGARTCTEEWLPSDNGLVGAAPVSSMDWRLSPAGGGKNNYVRTVQSPDGNSHMIAGLDASQYFPYTPPFPIYPSYAYDGTGLKLLDGNTLFLPTGTVLKYQSPSMTTLYPQPISVTDSNGNQITWGQSGWSDTMGRSIPGSPAPCNNNELQSGDCSSVSIIEPGVPTSDLTTCPTGTSSARVWNVPGLEGATRTFKFCYSDISLQTNFQQANVTEFSGSATAVLSAIVLPDLTMWRLAYDSYGDVVGITFPTGGTISYEYAVLTAPPARGFTQVSRYVTSRTVNAKDGAGDHVTRYTYSPYQLTTAPDGGTMYTRNVTVTSPPTVNSPNGDDTVYTVTNPVSGLGSSLYVTQVQSFQGAAGDGHLLKTAATVFSGTKTSFAGAINIVPVQNSITLPNGQTSKTVLTYDTSSFVNPGGTPVVIATGALQQDDYDFSGTLYRSTLNHYVWQDDSNYKNANLLTLRASSTTQDPSQNPAAQTAKTLYYHDQWDLAPSGVSQGLVAAPAGPYRGNVTSVARWVNTSDSYISTTNTYLDTGMMASTKDNTKDAPGNTTTFTYSTDFAGAYLTQTNLPDTQMPDPGAPVVHHQTSAKYNYNTGLLTSFTDENGNPFTYQYDNATLRLTQANHPDQGWTKFFYPNPTTVERQRLIDGSRYDDFFVYFDGLGRTIQTQQNTPTCTVLADTTYDAVGRVASVSNPYCQGSSGHASDPTYGLTETQYDALGRVLQVKKADGSVASVRYDNNCTTSTDESGRQKKTCSDAFGRVAEVDEAATYSPPVAATGSDTVTGTEQSAQVLSHAATSGNGSVQINGTVQWKTVSSATTGGTASITINGSEQQNPAALVPGTATIAIGGSEQIITAVAGSGSFSITGNEQSLPAIQATGSVTISGSEVSRTSKTNCTADGGCTSNTIYDSGTVTITANGYADSVSFGQGASSSSIAQDLVNKINGDTAAYVTATVSGSTVNLKAKASGPNYSFSTSVGEAFGSFSSSASGSTLTGGQSLTYDAGSVTLTVNGTANYSTNYGQGDTSTTIANSLAQQITAGTLLNATVSSSTITLTAKTTGGATNYSLAFSKTYDATHFSAASFNQSGLGSALTGGRNGVSDAGTFAVTANGHASPATQWGQNSTAASIASDLASKINADTSASVTATASGSSGPYRIQTSGGNAWYKYYLDFGSSQAGATYTAQVAIRNNGPAVIQVGSNLSSITVPPGATQNVVLNFNGNGTSNVQLLFGTVNTTSDPLDMTVWNPYVANVANGTNMVSASQSTFNGWTIGSGASVNVSADSRYAFVNLTSKTKGTVSNYTLSVNSTYDSADFNQSSFAASTSNGLGAQFLPISTAMLSSSGFGTEYYSGQIADGSLGCCGWGTDSSTTGSWLQIDLGAGNATAVTQARIYAASANYAGNYTIQYSDDTSTWTNATTGFVPNQLGWNSKAWSYAGPHRYWRLYLTNTPGGGSWLTELQLISQGSQTLALAGGWPNATAVDSGTMRVAINGNNYAINWGQNDSSTTIASNLYSALRADSAVTASLSGSTIFLTPKQSTYSFSTSYTFDSKDFSRSSFAPSSQISDYGMATITVAGHPDNVKWSGSDTPSTIAAGLANAINADAAALVNATASGGTISFSSRTTGANTNYTLASSVGFDTTDFSGSSFAPTASGSALTGGTDAAYSTVYDSGSVSLTLNGPNGPFQVSAPYQQSSTSSSVATSLANALNNTAGSPLIATVSGSTLSVKAAQPGAASNYSWSVTSTSNNALNGGSDGVPGSLATSWATLYFYDTRDNLKCVEQHGNVSSTGCSSDPGNDATSRWRVRRFTYDSLGHLLTSKNPENGTISYQYDSVGRLSTRTDARGIVATYQYHDTANGGVRLTDITYSDGTPASRLRYDYATYNSNTLSNPVGRQNVTLSDNGAKYLTSYDAMGRVASVQQCTPGVSVCQNFSANYNGLGEPLYMLYANGFQVNYSYDAAGRLTSAQDNAGFTYASTQPADFLASGAPKQIETANFNYQVSYNNRLQPVEISAGTFFDKQYNYNPGANNGDVISITNMKDNGRSQTFTYDSLNRLATAGDRKNWSDSYVYDPWANLTQKNPGTLQGESMQASADVRNHLIKQDSLGGQIYTYDPVGNLLTDGLYTYTYDAENRVKTVDGTTTYTYDGSGRRVSKSTGEHTWYGPAGAILGETDANGNWTNYVYAFGKRLARNTPRSAPNSPDIKFYVTDHLGSTNMFVDKDGKSIVDDNDLYPWGGVVPGIGFTNSSNHFTFTGKERDGESNLDYFGARYYSSNLGRWTSADWSAVPAPVPYANFGDPQTLNLHAYVRNLPTVGIDADGHSLRSYLQAPATIPDIFDEFRTLGQKGQMLLTIEDPSSMVLELKTYLDATMPEDLTINGMTLESAQKVLQDLDFVQQQAQLQRAMELGYGTDPTVGLDGLCHELPQSSISAAPPPRGTHMVWSEEAGKFESYKVYDDTGERVPSPISAAHEDSAMGFHIDHGPEDEAEPEEIREERPAGGSPPPPLPPPLPPLSPPL